MNRADIGQRVRALRNDPLITDDLMDRLIDWATAWSGGSEFASDDLIVRVICARLHVVVGAPSR